MWSRASSFPPPLFHTFLPTKGSFRQNEICVKLHFCGGGWAGVVLRTKLKALEKPKSQRQLVCSLEPNIQIIREKSGNLDFQWNGCNVYAGWVPRETILALSCNLSSHLSASKLLPRATGLRLAKASEKGTTLQMCPTANMRGSVFGTNQFRCQGFIQHIRFDLASQS